MNKLKALALIFGAAILGQATAWSQLSAVGIAVGPNNQTTIAWNNANTAGYAATTYDQNGTNLATGPWYTGVPFEWYTPPAPLAVDANNNPILGWAENSEAALPFDVGYWMFDSNDQIATDPVVVPPLENSNGPFITVPGFAVDSNGPIYDIIAQPQDGQEVETWQHFDESLDYLFSDSRFEVPQVLSGNNVNYAVASDGSGRQLMSSGGSAPSVTLLEPNPRGGHPGLFGGAFTVVNTGSIPFGSGWTGWYPVAVTTTPEGSTEILWDAYNGTSSVFSWWVVAPGPYGPTNVPPGTNNVTYMSGAWQFGPGWIAVGIAGSPFGGDGNIRILMQNNLGSGSSPTQFVVFDFNPTAGNEVTGYYVSPPPGS